MKTGVQSSLTVKGNDIDIMAGHDCGNGSRTVVAFGNECVGFSIFVDKMGNKDVGFWPSSFSCRNGMTDILLDLEYLEVAQGQIAACTKHCGVESIS